MQLIIDIQMYTYELLLYDGWKKLRHIRSYLYLLSKGLEFRSILSFKYCPLFLGSTMKVFVVFIVLGSVSQVTFFFW